MFVGHINLCSKVFGPSASIQHVRRLISAHTFLPYFDPSTLTYLKNRYKGRLHIHDIHGNMSVLSVLFPLVA